MIAGLSFGGQHLQLDLIPLHQSSQQPKQIHTSFLIHSRDSPFSWRFLLPAQLFNSYKSAWPSAFNDAVFAYNDRVFDDAATEQLCRLQLLAMRLASPAL